MYTSVTISRKNFIKCITPFALALAIPDSVKAIAGATKSKIEIGLISDLHQDIMHDGEKRLESFLGRMNQHNPDAIVQLGDFCYPNEKNRRVIDAFNHAHQTRLHVIGNHDTDGGYTHEDCVNVWGMPSPYYTRTVNGYHFIVLNGNEKGSPAHKGGYPAYISPAQTSWLKKQLSEISGPVIVLCHQPLAGYLAVDNALEIQEILSGASNRVILVINGHTHTDRIDYINEVPYLTVNSASYYWVGGNLKHQSYTEDIHQSHEWISSTCPYRDALFTTITIDPDTASIRVEANTSEWIGASPASLGYKIPSQLKEEDIVPLIRQRKISQRVKK